MRPAVLVGSGSRVYLVRPAPGPVVAFPLDRRPELGAARLVAARPEDVPPLLAGALAELPPELDLAAGDPVLAGMVGRRTGRSVRAASLEELREARARLPLPDPEEERRFLRELARLELEGALRAPPEVLIALAREEERVERALGREARAAESFVVVPASPLEEYARSWTAARSALARHHAGLRAEVETEASRLLPNLSRLVGPRIAARLLAAAGSVEALGRLRAPRLQLLGSRRRPSAVRGPRYGLLFRADRMDDVPLGRRGAYARSLAALAAIAARADATTHADLSDRLLARRDRRVDELRRRRSR